MHKVLPSRVSKQELQSMYNSEKLSIREIAEKIEVDKHTVIYWMDKWGVDRRSVSEGLQLLWKKDQKYRRKQTKRLLRQGFQKGDEAWWKKQGKPPPSTVLEVRQKISKAHKRLIGSKHPSWKPRVKCVCLYCGEEFKVKPYRKDEAKFCSSSCRAKYYLTDKHRQKMLKGCLKKPTKPEQKLINIIQREGWNFHYVGDGKKIINGLNPDFIHQERRQIIEVFGRVWHDPKQSFKDIPYHSTKRGRKEFYSKIGYDCLILWDNEILSDENAVITKIATFVEKGGVK